MRFSISFLLMIMVPFGAIALCAGFLSQTTYFFGCVFIPALIALTFRYFHKLNHVSASLLLMLSAISIGSLLLAYGSYDQTFNNHASGYLVGDGWNSVFASAIIGGLAGVVAGCISLLIYFPMSLVIGCCPDDGTLPDNLRS